MSSGRGCRLEGPPANGRGGPRGLIYISSSSCVRTAFSHLPSPRTLDAFIIWLDNRNTKRGTTQQAMAPLYLKLALNFPLLFLLFAGHILQPVAGQASPAPTPCRGAAINAEKIKDGYIFREGLSPPLDPGLARTLPYEGKKSNTWTNTSQSFFATRVPISGLIIIPPR